MTYSPPPQQPYPYPQHVVVAAPRTCGLATASMIFGIVGILGGWCLLGIPCVIAVVLGHGGLSHTKNGEEGGRGQAVAGLIMGYAFVVPAVAIFLLFVVGWFLPDVPASTPTP